MTDAAPLTPWSHLQRLLARLVDAVDQGDFLDDCLDLLVDALDADRGFLLVFHDDGATQVVNARGRGRALDPFERDEISRTVVQRARATGQPVVMRPADELSPAESMIALRIGTVLAAPMRGVAWREGASREAGGAAANRLRGLVYVDYRRRDRAVTDVDRELLGAAAGVMAAVLEPHRRMQAAREDLRALAAKHAEPGPDLDELLRPDSMKDLRREVASCLRGESSILVLGESGTGKTQLARAIAEASGRAPIVRATLGGSDDLNTIASELFGHEKGAFSGALARRAGLVEMADGGSLIFDEILNLPPQAQQLLLDFTQFGTYRPLGHDRAEPRRAKVRILAATNGDLDAAMRAGRFRQDLYFRLAAVTLHVPPLRARREDIPALAESVLRRADPGRELRLSVRLRRLLASPELPWPGNVRQLEAVVRRARERALHADPGATLLEPAHVEPRDLGVAQLVVPDPGAVRDTSAPLASTFQVVPGELPDTWARLVRERDALEGLERSLIAAALDKHGGVVAHAARDLGIGRTSLLSRMETLGIGRPPRSAKRAAR